MTTAQQAIAAVHAEIESHLGYTSGDSRRSKFDQNGWHGYWCARFIGTCTMEAIGTEAGVAAIGRQHGMTCGWAATWLWRTWLQTNPPGYPGLVNCRLGDVLMMRFPSPSGGRSKNPTNHVSWIVGGWDEGVSTIGGNTVGPAGSGSPGEGAGVWRHRRRAYIVGAYRPNWPAAARLLDAGGGQYAPPSVSRPSGQTSGHVKAVQRLLNDATGAGLTVDGKAGKATTAATRAYQADHTTWGHRLTVDGKPGPSTKRALEETMSTLSDIARDLASLRAFAEADHHDKNRRLGELSDQLTRLERGPITRIRKRVDRQAADQRQTMIALTRGNAVGDATNALVQAVADHDAGQATTESEES